MQWYSRAMATHFAGQYQYFCNDVEYRVLLPMLTSCAARGGKNYVAKPRTNLWWFSAFMVDCPYLLTKCYLRSQYMYLYFYITLYKVWRPLFQYMFKNGCLRKTSVSIFYRSDYNGTIIRSGFRHRVLSLYSISLSSTYAQRVII